LDSLDDHASQVDLAEHVDSSFEDAMRDNGFIRLISKTANELIVCWNAYSLKQVSLLTRRH
jgi:hypothetical protein